MKVTRGDVLHGYQKTIDEAIDDLKSSLQGLSSEEAKKRLEEYGPNELKEGKKNTALGMFLNQFKDFMIIVLILAAIISGIIGDAADTVAIIVIVVLNAIIGFVQEYRAEKAIAALKKMASHTAVVMRNGMPSTIPGSEIVPGDIVILDAGRVVPADMRIIETAQLKVEEAALTGESVPVEKETETLHDEYLPLGDRKNMAYKGTFVAYGRGKGIVVSTGMDTELGRIATMLQEGEEVKTPLQKRLATFGQRLAYIVLAICAAFFLIGTFKGEDVALVLLTAISLAVAAIPEALPAVVTISLALGARKMVKQNALIRKLPAVETLGSVTYICSDKTGTLTLNRMTVEEIHADGISGPVADFAAKSSLISDALFEGMALSNDTLPDAVGEVMGEPTEVALYMAAEKAGFSKTVLEKANPRVSELPFDSDRKRMTTFHRDDAGRIRSFTKGAVEEVLVKSINLLSPDGGVKDIDRDELKRESERMSATGLRVLAVGSRRWERIPEKMIPEEVESDLTFLGLVGIMDPPREEAKEAIAICKMAGIRPVMITGDHPLTARAIAGRLGIIEDDAREIITGRELEKLSMEEFEEQVEHIRVYARVAPEQKLKIVRALQDKGQFVAMTGDGVNDAPALKRADIGIAMGITGTDVSKEAAHMILLDDNFATIVKAVKEGRRIFDNIRKFLKYTMTSNMGEIIAIVVAPLLGLPIPLLPIHILWINLVTDGLPGLALAAEPVEKGIMQRPPRHPQESMFAQGLGTHIIWVGFLMGFATIFTQAWAINTDHSHWQTMVFTVLCLSQMGHVLAIRSEKESIFAQGFLSNKPLAGAFLLTFAMQMATIYIPSLNQIFKTEALTAVELAICLVLSAVVFVAVEIEKYFKRRGKEQL
ncbi:MAG: cation-translocating P-type ATPase [Syntrophales bacterium]